MYKYPSQGSKTHTKGLHIVDTTAKPFGYSYLIDLFDCKEGTADDMELHYRFLETLVDKIGMTKMSAPVVTNTTLLAAQTSKSSRALEEGLINSYC